MQLKWLSPIFLIGMLLTGCGSSSDSSKKDEETISAVSEENKVTEETVAPSEVPTAATEEAQVAATTTTEQTSQPTAPATTSKPASATTAASASQPAAQAPAASAAPVVSTPAPAAAPVQPKVESAPTPAPQPAPVQEAQKQVESVTLSIIDTQTGSILSATEVELQSGDTVFTVLSRTVKKKGIQMEYTGSGQGIYVQGINNLYEMDRGPKSGWRYYVNGTIADKSAGAFKVKQGDKIEWRYTDDYTKDRS